MCLYPKRIWTRPKDRPGELVTVSCGQCLECQQRKSNEWSHRIMDEAYCHPNNCFITLTYNNEHLPSDGMLVRRDVQLFIKRLRKFLQPDKIRVFYCGEYGKKRSRPHYHVIVFGWKPNDLFFWQQDKKAKLYRSPTLEKLWTFGFSSVGDLTLDSALYCAKYMQKQYNYAPNKGWVKPFIGMSNRPGIGYYSISEDMLFYDRIYHNGKSVPVPRYYLKVLDRCGYYLDSFMARRRRVGEMRALTIDLEARRKHYRDVFFSLKM